MLSERPGAARAGVRAGTTSYWLAAPPTSASTLRPPRLPRSRGTRSPRQPQRQRRRSILPPSPPQRPRRLRRCRSSGSGRIGAHRVAVGWGGVGPVAERSPPLHRDGCPCCHVRRCVATRNVRRRVATRNNASLNVRRRLALGTRLRVSDPASASSVANCMARLPLHASADADGGAGRPWLAGAAAAVLLRTCAGEDRQHRPDRAGECSAGVAPSTRGVGLRWVPA